VAFPWVMAALVLAAFTLVGIKIRSHRIAAAEAREAEKLKRLGEDPTVVALLEELQHGLSAAPVEVIPEVQTVISEAENQKLRNQAVSADDAAFLFFEIIPHEFKRLRERFSIITGFSDQTARLQMLAEMAAEIRPTKTVPQLPALRSYRLLALALEGLLKQLSCKAGNITDWRLQLASSSIGLLEDLCAPNLGPDLATKPPIRLLVVDDCAVSRRSMSMALKKVFPQPDLADGGEPALELTAQHVYDVIFLDIEMPGMDGFELCSRIRETPLNRATPIVFVTSHDNLESRAKLVTRGAQDLIGKPYLPTEINLKALQLSLQGRLQNGVSAAAVGATVDGAPLPAEPLSPGALTPAPSAG
jgi:CheY-like chemotaxis protein